MPPWVHISRRRSILAILTFVLAAPLSPAQSPAGPDLPSLTTAEPKALHTLTTLHEAHTLPAAEARRGYPIHVRAVVTYYDTHVDSRRIAFFLHDATGSIFAAAPQGTTWPGHPPLPGTLVDVSGVSAPGDFAPILDQAHIVVLRDSRIPAHAQPVTLADLLTGALDGQWVQIEGVVHSVSESGTNVTLQIAVSGGTIPATTVKHSGVDYQRLVDTWVHIQGNAAPTFNSNRQMTGSRLFFPGLETVTAQAPSSGDAFSRPVQPVAGLLRFNPSSPWPHRVHVRGTVTVYWPGKTLCLNDGTESLCAQTAQTSPLQPGSLVDLVGFTTLSGFTPTLQDATFHPLAGTATVSAVTITPAEALDGTRDSDLVRIEGQLIGRDLASNDTVLLLSSDKSFFRAILPASLSLPNLSSIPLGSTLRVTGICSTQVDPRSTLEGYGITHASRFSILLRSSTDVAILHTPSWWNTQRIGLALIGSMIFAIASFVWNFVLQRRVEQQTRALRESRERYRHMAHHDALTGLPTRTLLHDRLQNALDRAQRFHKSIALLMLDLDKFKQINDSFGHDGGDLVLQITAERIASTIRKTDSVARMGGDEFIVLLNDLTEPGLAEQIAAKIVAALSVPIRIGKIHVPVSVSVGVCIIADGDVDANALLKRVDAAMYRAKECGRSCFQVFTEDMIATPGLACASEFPNPPPIAASPDSPIPTEVSGSVS